MRDNLREALNTQIDTWAQMGDIDSIDRDHVVNRLKEILAAHPDETGTEPVGGLDELARHWRKDAS